MTTSLEVQLKALASKLTENQSIKLQDILNALEGTIQSVELYEPEVPAIIKLTEGDKIVLQQLPAVFGNVTVQERRELAPHEVKDLLDERAAIDQIAKKLDERKKTIAIMVKNHCDVEVDALPEDVRENLLRDEHGHYILPGSIDCPDLGKRFTREVRENAPTITAEALLEISKDSESGFSHEDYLACTTQTRVVDEAKATLHFREHPEAIGAFARAMERGKRIVSVYIRNLK